MAGPARRSAEADGASAIAAVRIGRIARPHGVRGGLRVALDNPESTTLETAKRVLVEADGEQLEYLIKAASRAGRTAMRLELAGVDTWEAAEALRGAIVCVATANLPPERANEFYDFRAIGCAVRTLDGRSLGTVIEIFGTSANDVLVVRDGASEVLIPVIADVIKQMDFDRHIITVDAIPGLLD